jgi:hypothetical protein
MGNPVLQLIIGLIRGGVGGNIAAAILTKYSLGPIGNTIVRLLGGAGDEQRLSRVGCCKTPACSVMSLDQQ